VFVRDGSLDFLQKYAKQKERTSIWHRILPPSEDEIFPRLVQPANAKMRIYGKKVCF